MNPLFEQVPITTKPDKDDWYTVIDPDDPSSSESYYFMEGDWYESEDEARVNEHHDAMDLDGYSWLRPLLPSKTAQEAAEQLRPKGVNRGVRWKEGFHVGVSWQMAQRVSEEDKDNFAISFAVWAMHHPDAQALQAAGITAYALLQKYKSRPYIDNNPNNQ